MALKNNQAKSNHGGRRAGAGRPKGSPNKLNKAVKEMILDALEEAGGTAYLVKQSEANPTAFMTLVGKVLPLQLTGDGGGPIRFEDALNALR